MLFKPLSGFVSLLRKHCANYGEKYTILANIIRHNPMVIFMEFCIFYWRRLDGISNKTPRNLLGNFTQNLLGFLLKEGDTICQKIL